MLSKEYTTAFLSCLDPFSRLQEVGSKPFTIGTNCRLTIRHTAATSFDLGKGEVVWKELLPCITYVPFFLKYINVDNHYSYTNEDLSRFLIV